MNINRPIWTVVPDVESRSVGAFVASPRRTRVYIRRATIAIASIRQKLVGPLVDGKPAFHQSSTVEPGQRRVTPGLGQALPQAGSAIRRRSMADGQARPGRPAGSPGPSGRRRTARPRRRRGRRCGPAAGHRLDDHPAERLGAGAGVDHDVQRPDRRGRVGLVAGEPDPTRAGPEPRPAPSDSSIVRCEPAGSGRSGRRRCRTGKARSAAIRATASRKTSCPFQWRRWRPDRRGQCPAAPGAGQRPRRARAVARPRGEPVEVDGVVDWPGPATRSRAPPRRRPRPTATRPPPRPLAGPPGCRSRAITDPGAEVIVQVPDHRHAPRGRPGAQDVCLHAVGLDPVGRRRPDDPAEPGHVGRGCRAGPGPRAARRSHPLGRRCRPASPRLATDRASGNAARDPQRGDGLAAAGRPRPGPTCGPSPAAPPRATPDVQQAQLGAAQDARGVQVEDLQGIPDIQGALSVRVGQIGSDHSCLTDRVRPDRRLGFRPGARLAWLDGPRRRVTGGQNDRAGSGPPAR